MYSTITKYFVIITERKGFSFFLSRTVVDIFFLEKKKNRQTSQDDTRRNTQIRDMFRKTTSVDI